MKPSLDGCLRKIDRAREHIDTLNTKIEAGAIDLSECKIDAKREFKVVEGKAPALAQEIIFTVQGAIPNVPPFFSIVAGEALYQLRSALDHLVYQLIVAKTNAPPTFNSAFPIIGNGKLVKKKWVSAAELYEIQTSRLKQDISSTALGFLLALQPFRRRAAYEDDPLWALSELNNTDKHRLLNLTVHEVAHYAVQVSVGERRSFAATFHPRIRLEQGAELGRMPLEVGTIDEIFDLRIKVKGDLLVDIAFDRVCGQRYVSVIPYLNKLTDYVDRVVKAFMTLPEWGWRVTWDFQSLHPGISAWNSRQFARPATVQRLAANVVVDRICLPQMRRVRVLLALDHQSIRFYSRMTRRPPTAPADPH